MFFAVQTYYSRDAAAKCVSLRGRPQRKTPIHGRHEIAPPVHRHCVVLDQMGNKMLTKSRNYVAQRKIRGEVGGDKEGEAFAPLFSVSRRVLANKFLSCFTSPPSNGA